MAGGGEKARLGDVGLVRLGLGARQLLVETQQLLGAFAHAPLQRLVGRLQRLLRLDRVGHVGVGRHQSPVRHPRGADLDHRPLLDAQPERLDVVDEALDAVGDEVVRLARAVKSALGVEAHDLFEPDPHPQHVGGQLEQLAEFAVPGEQTQVLVEHGDALAGMVERVLQHVAIVLDRGGRVVEQLQRGRGRDGAALEQQRQHEARGRRADGGGEQILGEAHDMDVGLARGIEIESARGGEGFERALRALAPEIARDGGDQLARRGRRPPHAQRLSHRRLARPDEHVGLQALHRA